MNTISIAGKSTINRTEPPGREQPGASSGLYNCVHSLTNQVNFFLSRYILETTLLTKIDMTDGNSRSGFQADCNTQSKFFSCGFPISAIQLCGKTYPYRSSLNKHLTLTHGVIPCRDSLVGYRVPTETEIADRLHKVKVWGRKFDRPPGQRGTREPSANGHPKSRCTSRESSSSDDDDETTPTGAYTANVSTSRFKIPKLGEVRKCAIPKRKEPAPATIALTGPTEVEWSRSSQDRRGWASSTAPNPAYVSYKGTEEYYWGIPLAGLVDPPVGPANKVAVNRKLVTPARRPVADILLANTICSSKIDSYCTPMHDEGSRDSEGPGGAMTIDNEIDDEFDDGEVLMVELTPERALECLPQRDVEDNG